GRRPAPARSARPRAGSRANAWPSGAARACVGPRVIGRAGPARHTCGPSPPTARGPAPLARSARDRSWARGRGSSAARFFLARWRLLLALRKLERRREQSILAATQELDRGLDGDARADTESVDSAAVALSQLALGK